MGTHAFVGVVESNEPGSGFRARYINGDGFPDHMGPTLAALWMRFGSVEDLLQVLVIDHQGGWSGLDAEQSSDFRPLCSDGYVVPGVGVAYEGFPLANAWITGSLDGPLRGVSSAQWGYLFCVETEEMALVRVIDGLAEVACWFSRSLMAVLQVSDWMEYL